MKFKNPLLLRQRRIQTSLGPVLLAATSRGVAGLWFEGQRHSPDNARWPEAAADDALLNAAQAQVCDYVEGRRKHVDLPLDLSHGTPFQQAVWQALCAIARGQTLRYGELASRIGLPRAVRAVGAAVGRNPISVIVPCHRVLGADGSLTGYAGGLARKARLLSLEGVAVRPVDLQADLNGAGECAPARPAARRTTPASKLGSSHAPRSLELKGLS